MVTATQSFLNAGRLFSQSLRAVASRLSAGDPPTNGDHKEQWYPLYQGAYSNMFFNSDPVSFRGGPPDHLRVSRKGQVGLEPKGWESKAEAHHAESPETWIKEKNLEPTYKIPRRIHSFIPGYLGGT